MEDMVAEFIGQSEWVYSNTPFPILGPGIVGFLLLTMSVAYAIRRWRIARGKTSQPEETSYDGLIVSAVLGLLALLLGFTFALAIDRYDTRRSLVLEESNAIGTAVIRAQLLEEPHRQAVTTLLRDYTANRVLLAEARSDELVRPLMQRNQFLQGQLLEATLAAAEPIRDTPYAPFFVQSMNEVFDIGAARVAARRAHVPSQVLTILLLYMAIVAFIIGYVMSASRKFAATAFLLSLFTIAFLLILDLDRPTRGSIRESQTAMLDLLRDLQAGRPPTGAESGENLAAIEADIAEAVEALESDAVAAETGAPEPEN